MKETDDLGILTGNSLPYLIDELFMLYQTKKVKQIMITGGAEHTTRFLKENLRKIGFELAEESEVDLCQAYLDLFQSYTLDKEIIFNDYRLNKPWSKENFFSLALGEIPRLRNDKDGYGPKGR